MIYFRLFKGEEIIFSNIKDNFNIIGSAVKKFERSFNDCQIELFATDYDSKLLSNKHIANKTIEAYVEISKIMESLREEAKQDYIILSHNLITSHSLLQDALEQIVPEESLATAENHLIQVDIVKRLLGADKQGSAESVLSIAKRVVDLQAQIEGFKILSGSNKLDIGSHNIQSVLRNIIYPFYEDFKQNEVNIKWHIKFASGEENTIKTDYKILNVALHHFLNNVAKYTLPYSYIDIAFEQESKTLSFSMMSIKIDKDELENIFKLRYRGRNANNIESGDGVGMYMVKKALDLLKATILIETDHSNHREGLTGNKYTFNKFLIQFPETLKAPHSI